MLFRSKLTSIKEAKSGIFVEGILFPYERIVFQVSKDISVYVGGVAKKYRGSVAVIKQANSGLLLINALDLESYVRGVLYHEVSHRWPLGAMKAQAVATRTYALYQTEQNKNQLFDVTSDIYSQVYGGRSAERYRTNLAANQTRGEVLFFNGKVLPAYFHSNCGGHTENVHELWEQDLKPLSGVVCFYCKSAPNNSWKKNFRSADIEIKLSEAGIKVGTIKEIRVIERNESGRIRKLEIISRDGRSTFITGKKFRDVIGPNDIKSNLYDIAMKGYYFDLIGRGWGHGVGMCQWGANEMAKSQFKYKDILEFYYPGAELRKLER